MNDLCFYYDYEPTRKYKSASEIMAHMISTWMDGMEEILGRIP